MDSNSQLGTKALAVYYLSRIIPLTISVTNGCSHPATSSGMVRRKKDTATYGYDFYNPTLYLLSARSVSKEDINQKFLRSLPPSWSQIALIIRNNPDIDQNDIDDLYNNLRVYEDEMKSQMSAHDKNGLGYGTQLNKMSDKSETDSEISMSVFEVRSSDEESTPANDRFSKADGYHAVPPPITGNFLNSQ
ncbi:hypothetical protein Tco_0612724 [Tanacetum coccineum]